MADIKFRTKVDFAPTDKINHTDRLLMLGSCFTENIGKWLQTSGFNLDLNPFGIAYNPLSIAKQLIQIMDGESYRSSQLFFHREEWHSMMHHSSFSSPDVTLILKNINERLSQAHSNLSSLTRLILTFGTAYVYEKDGEVVSNCHKLPEKEFSRRQLTVDEIVSTYDNLIKRLLTINSQLKIIITVSPIRYLRDGLLANQISKSTLLLAVNQLVAKYPNVIYYFPSYEIVIDELRDYRFYAEDMVHPSPLAIKYICNAFSALFFTKETQRTMAEIDKINRALEHRPFNSRSAEYIRFIRYNLKKIEQLLENYPNLDLNKQKELCRIQLNS